MNGPRTAYRVLHVGFAALPILAGADKFLQVMTEWEKYLAPWVDALVPGSAHAFMSAAGVVEIGAGILVAVAPRIGGFVVAGWLLGIIVNLVALPEYWDVAARDLGLALGALALGLASEGGAGRIESRG